VSVTDDRPQPGRDLVDNTPMPQAYIPSFRRLIARIAALAASALLATCGGDLGSGGSGSVPGSNVAAITIDGGPSAAVNGINSPYVSVTICEPGSTTNCQVIDHVLLDTGSVGLRLLASVVNTALSLPQELDTASQPLFECLDFADSYEWGSVRLADVLVADGKAQNLPVQVIGDSAAPTAPDECTRAQTATPLPPGDTVAALNANGILGVGVFREDCGAGCTAPPSAGDIYQYYTCATGCSGETLDTALQVQNVVYHFASNNNGVVIELPSVPAGGMFGARGSLVLGIATASNNALGNATVLAVDPATGFLTTTYKGHALAHSYIDSASKGLYFDDSIAACDPASVAGGLYCPGTAAPLALSASVQGSNGGSVQVDFTIGDGLALLQAQPTYSAFADIGGPLGDATAFDWGLPFFYGRNVYVAIEGRTAGSATGPYFAF
jgi:hypothetical protein